MPTAYGTDGNNKNLMSKSDYCKSGSAARCNIETVEELLAGLRQTDLKCTVRFEDGRKLRLTEKRTPDGNARYIIGLVRPNAKLTE